ncbi:hypothetical protein [Streptomyces sp. NPDC057199]|uniref:hypothetical protein n=1 Tax=Streptomyces sp. NPDC057199 TaxID=3346047 RepID=UPI003626CAEA
MELTLSQLGWQIHDQLFDGLALRVRWLMESAYVGENRWRVDPKRVGLRTDTSVRGLLPVKVDQDGTLRLAGAGAGISDPGTVPGSNGNHGWTVPEIPAFLKDPTLGQLERRPPDLVRLLNAREGVLSNRPWCVEEVLPSVLVLPLSPRWIEATSTALLGDWVDPLMQERELTAQAVSVLRAEVRAIHRQLGTVSRIMCGAR